jgi:hypothetical protein
MPTKCNIQDRLTQFTAYDLNIIILIKTFTTSTFPEEFWDAVFTSHYRSVDRKFFTRKTLMQNTYFVVFFL